MTDDKKSGALVSVRIVGVSELAQAVAEGGALRLLIGARGADALSELVAAGVAIPTAKLRAIQRRIESDTEGRAAVDAAAFQSLAATASTDPDYLRDLGVRALGRQMKEQENADAVAALAAEKLQQGPIPEPLDEPVDADFMGLFASLVGRANSDAMRSLFAGILAGEIRKPGAYSLATLNLLAVMDKPLAEAVVEASGWVLGGAIPVRDPLSGGEPYKKIGLLADHNIVRSGLESVTWTPAPGERHLRLPVGAGRVAGPGLSIELAEGHTVLKTNCHSITRMGMEVLSLMEAKPPASSIEMLADALMTDAAVRLIALAVLVPADGGLINVAIRTLRERN